MARTGYAEIHVQDEQDDDNGHTHIYELPRDKGLIRIWARIRPAATSPLPTSISASSPMEAKATIAAVDAEMEEAEERKQEAEELSRRPGDVKKFGKWHDPSRC